MGPKHKGRIRFYGKENNDDLLEYASFPDPFRSLDGVEEDYLAGSPAKTLLELELLRLSYSIRNKRNWHLKVRDPEITKKWTAEALAQGAE